MRLNLFNMRDASRDKKRKAKKDGKETKPVEKTMQIEGMMCGHCEAAVKRALEALPGVEAAEADHEAGTAFVTLRAEVPDSALKQAVEAEGYTVVGIQ